MSLNPYKVTVYGHETTLLLSDEDARSQGLLKEKAPPAEKKAAPQPPNKARKAPNKSKG